MQWAHREVASVRAQGLIDFSQCKVYATSVDATRIGRPAVEALFGPFTSLDSAALETNGVLLPYDY